MSPALLIRLRPEGPWRSGPSDGAHDRIDSLFRSDRLYSAVCHAMQQLGHLDEWLAATAQAAQPAVVLSSLFPFQGEILFAPPPETVWPPAVSNLRTPSPVFLTKVRWRAAKFVPISVIEALLTGTPLQADQWIADAESGCLLRRDRPQSSPFRLALRVRVPVDRVTGVSAEPYKAACVEFEQGAGLWAVALFASAEAGLEWRNRLAAAFRVLCDTGFGGSRSSGWGHAGTPEISEGNWPAILLPKLAKSKQTTETLSSLHWLLSIYSPAESDSVQWGEGRYSLVLRSGRVESKAGSGAVKKTVRMVSEGSVLSSTEPILGRAVDVAPEGFAHPVYRAGFALALQLPVIHIVETPEPEPGISEMDATLAAALAAAEEERVAAEGAPAVGTPSMAEKVPTPPIDPPIEPQPLIEPPAPEPQPEIDPRPVEPPATDPPPAEPTPDNSPIEEPPPESRSADVDEANELAASKIEAEETVASFLRESATESLPETVRSPEGEAFPSGVETGGDELGRPPKPKDSDYEI